MVISYKSGCHGRIDGLVYRHVGSHVIGDFSRRPGRFSLHLHGSLESLFIHRDPLLLQDLSGKIQRESISIIELEGLVSSQRLLPLLLQFFFHLRQNRKSLVDGLVKLLFLFGDYLEDKLFLLVQFRITVLRSLDHGLGKLGQEFSLDIQKSSVTAGSPQQTAQNIPPSFVRRHDPVRDHKGYGTDVIRDHTDGHICVVRFAVLCACQSTHMLPQSLDGIHVKHGIYALYDTGQTLQAHSGINIFLLQFGIMIIAVIVKLGKYIVPDLHVPVAVTAYGTIRFPAAVLLSPVIVNL